MKKYLAIAGAGLMMIGTAGMAAAATVDVGGEVRIKYEMRENLAFDDNTSNNEHGTHQRTRVNVNAKVSDEISAFIQLQNIRTWGTEASVGTTGTVHNDTNTDTHQAYLQVNKVFGSPLSVRLGRQELSYANERLIGSLNWADSARAFDAVKAMYRSTDIDVDVWAAKTVESSFPSSTSSAIVTTTNTGSGQDNDEDFYGVWATYKGIKDNTIDLYALLLKNNGSSFGATTINGISYGNSVTGNSETAVTIYTYGAHIKGVMNAFDYDVELDYQTGKALNGNDIDAMAYTFTAGYTLAMDMSPRISVEYVHADGDDSTTDSNTETFNQLFPTGHRHLGYADLVGFQNVEAWRVGVNLKPTKASSVSVDYWNFKLDDEKDAWYRASGGVVKPASNSNGEDEIGSEIDLIAKYKYADNLTLEAGYSLFMTGDMVKPGIAAGWASSGSMVAPADNDDLTFVYGMVTLTF